MQLRVTYSVNHKQPVIAIHNKAANSLILPTENGDAIFIDTKGIVVRMQTKFSNEVTARQSMDEMVMIRKGDAFSYEVTSS